MNKSEIIQSEISQKEKDGYHILTQICEIYKSGIDDLICKTEIDTDVKNKHEDTKRGKGEWDELGDWD